MIPVATSRDRRRDYERRHLALGLCQRCASTALDSDGRCFRHWIFARLRKAGLTKGVLPEKSRSARDKLVAYLLGRYHSILAGYLNPVNEAQALRDAVEVRARLGIRWGGIRGASKTAKLIRVIERRAEKEKRDAPDNTRTEP